MALGFTAAVHRKSAKAAREKAFSHMRATRKALAKGSCHKAVKELTLTAAWHGVASADFAAATKKRSVPITRKHVEKLEREVLKKCACSRKR